jgi:hypothetical protein
MAASRSSVCARLRRPEPCPCTPEPEREARQHGGRDQHQIDREHAAPEEVERRPELGAEPHGTQLCPPEQHHDADQHRAESDRGDELAIGVAVLERADRDALLDRPHDESDQPREQERDDDGESCLERGDTDEGGEHHQVSGGEVQCARHDARQRVPERDEGVDRADGEPAEDGGRHGVGVPSE